MGTLYGCPQSLFKIHPDFDPVLADIARGDPGGRIVMIEGGAGAWTEALKARWARTHPILLDQVAFVPRLSSIAFLALMSHLDVVLDPPHFGSGNTLYEGMIDGAPVVDLARPVRARPRRLRRLSADGPGRRLPIMATG